MIYLSTACIKSDFVLDAILELGSITKNIELSGGGKYQECLLERIDALKNSGYNFLVHSYFPIPKESFVLNFASTTSQTRDFIHNSMKYVEMLNIDYYSIHAGFKKDFDIKDELLINGKNNFDIINIQKNIEWFYKEYPSYKIALENLYPNNKNDVCFANTLDEIEEILNLDSRIYLLLDLGHLKVSSRLLGFNYLEAVDSIFDKYYNRILEIHLSENYGEYDDHSLVLSDSVQYFIIDRYKNLIKANNINLTIETRNHNFDDLKKSFDLFHNLLGEKNEL